jgi:hypothetical protein
LYDEAFATVHLDLDTELLFQCASGVPGRKSLRLGILRSGETVVRAGVAKKKGKSR